MTEITVTKVIAQKFADGITVSLTTDGTYWECNVWKLDSDGDRVYLNNTGSLDDEEEARMRFTWDVDCFLG
jgi:hypothetical protein